MQDRNITKLQVGGWEHLSVASCKITTLISWKFQGSNIPKLQFAR